MSLGTTQFMQIVVSSLFVLAIFLSHPSKDDHLMKGDTFYQSCDNEQALKEYQLAYNDFPSDYNTLLRIVRIHNDIGRIQLRTGSESEKHYRLAAVYADSLQRYYPDSAAAHFWFALAKGSLIPFVGVRENIAIGKEVKQQLQAALQRDSTFSYAYVLKAIFEREGSQLSWFEKGIVRIVFDEDLSGSLHASEQYLRKALHYDTTNSFAYYELYWTYRAMEDTASARSALQHVLKMLPRNLREHNQQEEAQQQLQVFINTNQIN
jgi:tetratricopeptide (TPR) repeat protein